MKKFFSPQIFTESNDLFAFLVDLIDSKYICDRNQILKDISLRKLMICESDGKEKFISYGDVHVHTARTAGIKTFCLSCSKIDDGNIEILILWNDISAHILNKLSELTKFLKSTVNKNFSCEHIIYKLKKL